MEGSLDIFLELAFSTLARCQFSPLVILESPEGFTLLAAILTIQHQSRCLRFHHHKPLWCHKSQLWTRQTSILKVNTLHNQKQLTTSTANYQASQALKLLLKPHRQSRRNLSVDGRSMNPATSNRYALTGRTKANARNVDLGSVRRSCSGLRLYCVRWDS